MRLFHLVYKIWNRSRGQCVGADHGCDQLDSRVSFAGAPV